MAATAEHIKEVNTVYHDAAAESYDAKWGIDWGEVGQRQVVSKFRKALGAAPELAPEALEIGAGTGYFTLNLLQAGLLGRATATDISPGMLSRLSATARGLGLEVETRIAEAEHLPFADESFDLVFGHAVLHHIPRLDCAFSEFARVLRPGGRVVFCGEPSRHGDTVAALPKRLAVAASPAWRRLVGAGPRRTWPEDENCHNGHDLEAEVDVHAFTPGGLHAHAREAGLVETRVRGEELLANLAGWTFRTMEASAEPDEVPMAWRRFAFHTYLTLQGLDGALLEPVLPPQLFYNLLFSARKPA